MRKSKSLLNDKLKSVGKTLSGLALIGAGYLISSQDAYAQIKSEYKNHDKGAKFGAYSTKTEDIIEEKVFYNPATKKEERFYIQHLDKDLKNKYKNDLNIAAFPFYNTMPLAGMGSGNMSHFVSDSIFLYHPIAEKSLEITGSHVPDLCDDQIRELAGATKGMNYISTSYVKDFFKKLKKDIVLELENGEAYLTLPLSKDKQIKGKTNHLLIPLDDEHLWGVDPKTKMLWAFGIIYEGLPEEGSAMISGNTGLVSKLEASKLGEKDNLVAAIQEAERKESKTSEKDSTNTKKNLYLILGAEGNKEFLGGDLGVQYGPFALVGNYGKAKDENIKTITTPASPSTGRYGFGTEDNTDINVKGLAFEFHPFYNKRISHNKRISPFVGGGANNWNYTTEITEQIKDANDNVIKQKINSATNSENSWKAYGGINFGRNSKFGVLAGYDSKSKLYAGARYSIKLGKK